MIRMVIADDHAIVRGAFGKSCRQPRTFRLWPKRRAADDVLPLIRAGIDVLLLDISLPGLGGLGPAESVAGRGADCACFGFVDAERRSDCSASLEGWSKGLHHQRQRARRVAGGCAQGGVRGDSFAGPCCLVDSVVFTNGETDAHPKAVLTEREYQILQSIVSGLALGDIADKLHLSPKTVSTHKMDDAKVGGQQ